MSDQSENGGLHIDGDWKEEAAREKQRIAEEEQAKSEGGAEAGKPGFVDLVNMMALQAAIGLGGYQGPGGEQIPPNIQLTKHYIDMLTVLDEKTKGNLSEQEAMLLNGVLHDLRMQYVQQASGSAGHGGAASPFGGGM